MRVPGSPFRYLTVSPFHCLYNANVRTKQVAVDLASKNDSQSSTSKYDFIVINSINLLFGLSYSEPKCVT
jgi:hypothetical protein